MDIRPPQIYPLRAVAAILQNGGEATLKWLPEEFKCIWIPHFSNYIIVYGVYGCASLHTISLWDKISEIQIFRGERGGEEMGCFQITVASIRLYFGNTHHCMMVVTKAVSKYEEQPYYKMAARQH